MTIRATLGVCLFALLLPAAARAATPPPRIITQTITTEDPVVLTTFQLGDTVTITVTIRQLGPIDPNGLPTQIVVDVNYYSGLHQFALFRQIGFTETHTFIADGPGFIDAYKRGPIEGDITITINAKSQYTPQQIQDAENLSGWIATGSKLVGSAGIVCAVVGPVASRPCAVGFSLSAAGMWGLSAWLHKIATDPSDPNFMVIAQPIPIVLPTGMDCGGFPACDALVETDLQILALARAMLTTNDRIQGAIDAGDANWQTQQEQALRAYQIQLAALASAHATRLQAFQAGWQTVLASAGGTPLTVTAADVAAYDASLQGGWTFDQQQRFTAMGFTPQEQDAMLAFALDATGAVGDFPELLTRGEFYNIVGSFVQAFGDGTQAIPTPPVIVAMALKSSTISLRKNARVTVALLGHATFDATAVNPATITFGPTGTEAAPLSCDAKDFDRDGRLDLVCQFVAIGFALGDTSASAKLVYGGTRFVTSTSIVTR